MNNFKDGGFKKRRNDFDGKSKFGGGGAGRGNRSGRGGGNKFTGHESGGRPTETFKAECSKCHKACSLPFRPDSERSVFCSDCFAKKSFDNSEGNERQENDKSSRNEHTKLPRDQRSPRHDRPQAHLNKELADVKRQLEVIEHRLNRILDIVSPPIKPKKSVERTQEEEIVEPEVLIKKTAAKSVKRAVAKKAPAKAVKKVVKKTAASKRTVKKVAAKKVVKKAAKAKK